MDSLKQLLQNQPIITAAISWGVAALAKFIIVWVTSGKMDWERLLGAGGMPSTHTTPVVGCVASIGLVEGFHSSLFALGAALAVIVAYDATGIRRHAGEQARAINSLIKDLSSAAIFKETPKDLFKKWNLGELQTLLGHNPMEVAVGVILGIIVAIMVNFNWDNFPAVFHGT